MKHFSGGFTSLLIGVGRVEVNVKKETSIECTLKLNKYELENLIDALKQGIEKNSEDYPTYAEGQRELLAELKKLD